MTTPQNNLAAKELARALDPAILMTDANLTPDRWQLDVLRSTSKRLLLCCSRQSGKSTTAACLCLHQALYTPKSLVLLIAAAERQSKELLHKLKEIYRALADVPELMSESTLAIEFQNGSRIFSLPANEGTIRGFSGPDLVVIDEAAKTSDDLTGAIFPMMVSNPNGRVLALSTPYGKRGWFYTYWIDNPRWERVSVKWTDIERLDKEEIEAQRHELGDMRFREEFECAFLDDNVAAFSVELIQAALDPSVQIWPDL